jgi:hypothetical protein
MVDLDSLNIEPTVLGMISKTSALELSVLPIPKKNGVVIVAVPEKYPEKLLTDVQFVLGTTNVKPIPVSRDNIVAAINYFYETKPTSRVK